jgi:hypothetical protein
MTPNQIAVVITRASKSMRVHPDRVMEKGKTDKPTTAARRLAFYYLFSHGDSIRSIAAVFKMGEDSVKRGINHVKYRLDQYKAELAAIDGREG